MMPTTPTTLVRIDSCIHYIREQRVMLDSDLAALYGVETKRFNEAVKRNAARFPTDFMFTLTAEEFATLRSQFATSNNSQSRGGRRYAPRAFTEHGALMASTVLSSPRAIEIAVYVVRAFVRLREMALNNADLSKRLEELEQKTESIALSHDNFSRNTRAALKQVFDAIRALTTPPDPPKRPIGFVTPEDAGKKPTRSNREAKK